ncbi:MAG: transcription termination factor NusA [bacterium]
MMTTDLNRVIEQVGRDKGIAREVLVEALESAMLSAARKKFGLERNLEAKYNDELGEVEVFEFRVVVEEPERANEVSVEEAKRIDPDAELGDELGEKIDTTGFGRIAAQAAKQIIIQKMRDAERELVLEEFTQSKGEIVNGIVQRFERGAIAVNLGRTEAYLPPREQIPRENYRQGDRVRALVLDIQHTPKGPQIILSRGHPDFLAALFKLEVPEIYEGIVEIKGAVREPGVRAKIAVVSHDRDVDPVGACVGMKGSRVQAVVQELRGEKIDIVPWVADIENFACNALAPAEVSSVVVDEARRTLEVIVADEQLSLAIGKRGQNVRLASRLLGWKIDVKSETKVARQYQDAHKSLGRIPGVGLDLINTLYEAGYLSATLVAQAQADDLAKLDGLGDTIPEKLIEDAKRVAASEQAEREEESHRRAEEEKVAEIQRELTQQPKPTDAPSAAGKEEARE